MPDFLELIFPTRCAGCGVTGSRWCRVCAGAVRSVPVAAVGSIPLVAAGRLEGPWQQAIHTYKYWVRPQLGTLLAARLAQAVREGGPVLEALTFIPLHPRRRKARGFNQAERLARELGRIMGLPVRDGLVRRRDTPAQVGLTQAERRRNVLGAFQWERPARPGRALGLVDDVCTTGATLDAAAGAIRHAGGEIAAFLVLARPQTLGVPSVTSPASFPLAKL